MMNDHFLYEFQEKPRAKYADALYHKINNPLIKTFRYSANRRVAVSFLLAILVLVLTVLFIPPARVIAQEIIQRIGNLFITNQPTYAEKFETAINSATPSPSPSARPEVVDWQAPGLLSMDEAAAQAGFQVAYLSQIPDLFTVVYRFVSTPDPQNQYTQVTTTFSNGIQNLAFSQTVYQPDAIPQTLPVGESPVTQITVQGVDGLWIENLRLSTYVDENNLVDPQFANLLVWEVSGMEYALQSTPGLSQAEMLEIANSMQLK